MFVRSFSLRCVFVLWDNFIIKGRIVFFQLLLSVFEVLKNNKHNIDNTKLFESLKLIILENELLILNGIKSNIQKDLDIKKYMNKFEINVR